MTTDLTESGINRRREQRLEYIARCLVDVKSPSWAMSAEPLEGSTENITRNGVKVIFSEFSHARYERWNSHLLAGDTISVVVRLPHAGQLISLPGQVAWTRYEGTPRGFGECSVGVLLALLSPASQRAVDDILADIKGSV